MGLLSGLNPFKSEKQKSKSASSPWQPAKPALEASLGYLDTGNATPWTVYGGPNQADFNQYQRQAAGQGQAWYGDNRDLYRMQTQGSNLLSALGDARSLYWNQANKDPVRNRGADLGMAARYADNPYLSQMIDAAAQDITRNLGQVQLPGIAGGSVGAGQLGGSRRGMLEGMAYRDAGDRIGDISANLRGQSWSQGLDYANAIASQNANFAMQQRGLGMGAAAGLAGLGAQGSGLMQGANALFNQNNAALMGIGNQLQNYKQQGADMARQNWYINQQLPYQQAQMGAGVALPMAQAFGITSGTNAGGGPSMGQQIGQLGLQTAGMGSLLDWW